MVFLKKVQQSGSLLPPRFSFFQDINRLADGCTLRQIKSGAARLRFLGLGC
jgi:hypothetical protein